MPNLILLQTRHCGYSCKHVRVKKHWIDVTAKQWLHTTRKEIGWHEIIIPVTPGFTGRSFFLRKKFFTTIETVSRRWLVRARASASVKPPPILHRIPDQPSTRFAPLIEEKKKKNPRKTEEGETHGE